MLPVIGVVNYFRLANEDIGAFDCNIEIRVTNTFLFSSPISDHGNIQVYRLS